MKYILFDIYKENCLLFQKSPSLASYEQKKFFCAYMTLHLQALTVVPSLSVCEHAPHIPSPQHMLAWLGNIICLMGICASSEILCTKYGEVINIILGCSVEQLRQYS